MPVSGIEAGQALGPIAVNGPQRAAEEGFSDYFKDLIEKANAQMAESDKMSADFADGKTNNIHETLLAAEKATIAFRLVGSIRNKMIEAYQEVMRIPV